MNIDDKDQLEIEGNIHSSQGVDIDIEKKIQKQGNPCNHNHKKKKKKFCSGSNQEKIYIVLFTMFMPANCIILQYFWLHDIMENYFERNFSLFLMFINYIMLCVCYYQAIMINNKPLQKAPPQTFEIDKQIKEVYLNNKICDECHYWKPLRTSHCSTCEACTLKMDHHCPWVINCVGLRNHRSFYLFTFYMAFGASQYLYRSFKYFFFLLDLPSFWDNNLFFYPYWGFTTMVLVPMTMMLIGLVFFHSSLIMTNKTTLDTLKSHNVDCPCLPDPNPQKKSINPDMLNIFDQGIIANIKEYFNGQRFMFWWPYENSTANDGTTYRILPKTNQFDVIDANYGGENQPPKPLQEGKINDIQILQSFDEELEKEMPKYIYKNLQFGEKIFEVWRDVQGVNQNAKLIDQISKYSQDILSDNQIKQDLVGDVGDSIQIYSESKPEQKDQQISQNVSLFQTDPISKQQDNL